MKIMTILGTRPEIIRLSCIIPKLDAMGPHVLVHTGQNYDHALNDIFFQELGLRAPDVFMGVKGQSFSEQVGQILAKSEELMREHKPDALLLLGDTNSALTAYVAKRLGIPVFHMEAGNRCYDDRVPEEVNRRVIDHSSDILMPYTHNSASNLRLEGIEDSRIVVTGNPIWEVIKTYWDKIEASTVRDTLGLRLRGYFLVTLHRAENVDIEDRFKNILEGLQRVQRAHNLPVIVSTHPRTRDKMKKFGFDPASMPGLTFPEPFGFFDFVALERDAACVLSDSGTVQEECCILKVPNVALRDVTERQETIQCGSNTLTGADPARIEAAVARVIAAPCDWTPPAEYLAENVSDTVLEVIRTRKTDPVAKIRNQMARFGIEITL